MNALFTYLDSIYSCAQIDLTDKKWQTKAQIPAEPGWYFIRTNAPLCLLRKQTLWSTTYTTKTAKTTKVLNYDLAKRAGRYTLNLSIYWNTTEVYSGMASNLMARAREHTFPAPGTGGLALSRYLPLHSYEWSFCYLTLARFMSPVPCNEMLLHLGEQIWRSKHGWPILCAE